MGDQNGEVCDDGVGDELSVMGPVGGMCGGRKQWRVEVREQSP
jgi:hypothetical protein